VFVVAVLVDDLFMSLERPAKNLLHHIAMFEHPASIDFHIDVAPAPHPFSPPALVPLGQAGTSTGAVAVAAPPLGLGQGLVTALTDHLQNISFTERVTKFLMWLKWAERSY
jgi:hypothetical protein